MRKFVVLLIRIWSLYYSIMIYSDRFHHPYYYGVVDATPPNRKRIISGLTKSSSLQLSSSSSFSVLCLLGKIRGGNDENSSNRLRTNDNNIINKNQHQQQGDTDYASYATRTVLNNDLSHLETTQEEKLMSDLNHVVPTNLLLEEKVDFMIDQMKKFIQWFVSDHVLWYQPPIGLVSVLVLYRLFFMGRIFVMYHDDKKPMTLSSSTEHNSNQPPKKMKSGLDLSYTSSTNKKRRRRNEKEYRGRSYKLDFDDATYDQYGEIQHVRTQLCLHALNGFNTTTIPLFASKDQSKTSNSSKTSNHDCFLQILQHLHHSLTITNHPQQSRFESIHKSIYHYSKLEYQLATISKQIRYQKDFLNKMSRSKNISSDLYDSFHQLLPSQQFVSVLNYTTDGSDLVDTIEIALLTSEIRILDSLLRLCRDTLLQSTYRLTKSVEYWNGRVKRINGHSIIWSKMENTIWNFFATKDYISKQRKYDRIQLSYAEAAYQSELQRLGTILHTRMNRPDDLPDSALVQALMLSNQEKSLSTTKLDKNPNFPHDSYAPGAVQGMKYHNIQPDSAFRSKTRMNNMKENHTIATPPIHTKQFNFSFPNLFKYQIGWKGDGKGFFTIRKHDLADITISPSVAIRMLLTLASSGNQLLTTSDNPRSSRQWIKEADMYTSSARQILGQVVLETFAASLETVKTYDDTKESLHRLQTEWYDQRPYSKSLATIVPNETNYEHNWHRMVRHIEILSTMRRIGEGQEIRLKEALGMIHWLKQVDVFGIPSSLLAIVIARWIYNRSCEPYWKNLKNEVYIIFAKLVEIIITRFWIPLVGIYNDIMNKGPSMMSAFGLDVEEKSLDRMLQDLGFGDGTPVTRQEALKHVTRQYEKDVVSGLFTNLVSGRLIRLQLIQMQQLKVGLLSALDTIDILLKGNRVHFHVLAAIPAILIVTFTMKLFVRLLYNLRAKDIRPVTAVHEEMNNYINKVEQILLLSSEANNIDQNSTGTATTSHSRIEQTTRLRQHQNVQHLTPVELAEITLNLHRYLILMDFCSPPYSLSLCDEIHQALQTLTGVKGSLGRLDSDRNIKWLLQIRTKHQMLLKGL
jgi:ATP synthase regulation protein NCA2